MLNEFENWFQASEPRLRARNCLVTITRPASSTDNNSVYADLENENYLARATVWESGEYQQEAIDPETGESLSYEYKVLHKPEELNASLENFVEALMGAVSAHS